MKQLKRRSDCPINFVLELLGDKWTLLIIRELMFKGKHFYGEFQQIEEKISSNTLANRLALLESSGMITKSSHPSHSQKIMCRLTQKGIDLIPILIEMVMWAVKHDKQSAVDKEFVKKVKKDRAGLIAQISKVLAEDLVA